MARHTLLLSAAIAQCAALNPAIKLAGKGMALLGPVFTLENKLQATALGAIGGVDADDVKQEIAEDIKAPCVIYTYGCLLYTSPSPRDATLSRMPSSA